MSDLFPHPIDIIEALEQLAEIYRRGAENATCDAIRETMEEKARACEAALAELRQAFPRASP